MSITAEAVRFDWNWWSAYFRIAGPKRENFPAKYVTFKSTSKGKVTDDKVKAEINQEAIDEDLRLAGYNLLVTSEIKASSRDIYKTYHNLWRIEESFRIMKSDLDARPVFLQKEETIKGHFLIETVVTVFLLLTV